MICSPSESWIKKKIKVTHEYQPGKIKPLLCQQTGIEEKQACINIQHHNWKRIILLLSQPNGTPDKTQTERQSELSKANKEAKTNSEKIAKKGTLNNNRT